MTAPAAPSTPLPTSPETLSGPKVSAVSAERLSAHEALKSGARPYINPLDPKSKDLPLVFAYSESKATGMWLTKTHLLGLSRLAATSTQWWVGKGLGSGWRMASSIMGLVSNISYFVWGESNKGRTRELEIAHGVWKEEKGLMTTSMQGELPKATLLQIESIMASAELPPGVVKTHYDKKNSETRLEVKAEHFNTLQEGMKRVLDDRIEAISVLQNPDRIRMNGTRVQSINRDGMSDGVVNSLKHVVEGEWNVPTNIALQADGRWMHIPSQYQEAFMRQKSPDLSRLNTHIKVPSLQEQPSNFWESLVNPGKFPMQFGILVGGIISNVLRLVAAATEANKSRDGGYNGKLPETSDMIGTVISQVAYIIEGQREMHLTLPKPSVIEGITEEKSGLGKAFQSFSNNPMIASLPMKGATIYLRNKYADGLATKFESDPSMDPGKAKQVVQAAKVSVFFDMVTALISMTTRKTDYGR